MVGWSLLSAGLAIAVAGADRAELIPAAFRIPVAILPVVPLIAFFFKIADWLESLDELERRIHLEAMIVQFGVTGILLMTYTMLAGAEVVPNLPATTVLPLVWLTLFVAWAGGIYWVRRRYR